MKIEGTRTSPSVIVEKGIFELKGRSILEDAHLFFQPIINAIQVEIKDPADATALHIRLDYINSGSKKYLAKIMCLYNDLFNSGKDVKVHWCYDSDDDSILELGNDFRSMVSIPFFMEECQN